MGSIDKQSIALISAFVIFVVAAAIISTGLVPEIYRQGEQLNQTQSLVNLTQLFLQQQEHEDAARANQSTSENQARDEQRYKIVNETYTLIKRDTNKSLYELKEDLNKSMSDAETRYLNSSKQRDTMLDKILSLQEENKQTQLILKNLTNEILDVLNDYGSNGTEGIVENQKMLTSIYNKLK